jgi:hypothetical protein
MRGGRLRIGFCHSGFDGDWHVARFERELSGAGAFRSGRETVAETTGEVAACTRNAAVERRGLLPNSHSRGRCGSRVRTWKCGAGRCIVQPRGFYAGQTVNPEQNASVKGFPTSPYFPAAISKATSGSSSLGICSSRSIVCSFILSLPLKNPGRRFTRRGPG